MTYLADTSAVWRLPRGQLGAPWHERVARGLVAICPPVESELMPGLHADRDYIEVQRDLVKIGHHRGRSPLDVLIALTAEHHGLTLLHVDDDFAAIAKVRSGLSLVRGEQPIL